jgi:hypothetical protein
MFPVAIAVPLALLPIVSLLGTLRWMASPPAKTSLTPEPD